MILISTRMGHDLAAQLGKRVAFFIGVLCLSAGCAAVFAADTGRDFAADVVVTDATGRAAGKAFISGQKVRLEIAGTVLITRADRNKAWVLVPAEHLYVERPVDRKFVRSVGSASGVALQKEFIANETVDARPVKKYKMTYPGEAGESAVYQWLADGEDLPVKTAAVDGSWSVEYRNIVPGPLDQALFSVPESPGPAAPPFPAVVRTEYTGGNDNDD